MGREGRGVSDIHGLLDPYPFSDHSLDNQGGFRGRLFQEGVERGGQRAREHKGWWFLWGREKGETQFPRVHCEGRPAKQLQLSLHIAQVYIHEAKCRCSRTHRGALDLNFTYWRRNASQFCLPDLTTLWHLTLARLRRRKRWLLFYNCSQLNAVSYCKDNPPSRRHGCFACGRKNGSRICKRELPF